MFEGFYTYLYCDPRTGSPFYVGKGRGGRAYARNNRSKAVVERIKEIESHGLGHTVDIVSVPTEEDAFWFESDLISSLGRVDTGNGPLLNHSEGGDGFFGRQSDEGRRSISNAMTGNKRRNGKTFTSEGLKRISAGVRKSLTPERLEKLKLAGLKGSRRSAEMGLNKLGGTHSGAFKKGHRTGGYSNF